MRILLVSVNRLRFPYPVYPVGLDYVAARISPPHEVRILDLCPLEPHQVDDAVASAVTDFRPGAVGLSLRNIDNTDGTRVEAYVCQAQRIVNRVRAVSRVPVILGGAGFAIFPAELMRELDADYGIVGEGEGLPDLLEALAAGRAPEGGPGVATRECPSPPRGARYVAARRPLVTTGLNPAMKWYIRNGGVLGMQTAAGCGSRCTYCTYPMIDGEWRARFPGLVAAGQALHLERAGARFIFLTDSVFNGDEAHALSVASAFQESGLRTPWAAMFAPVSPTDGFYATMAAGGCTHVEFGTEALSDTMLERFRKPFRREDVVRAHRAAREAGLHVAHFFLLGGPGETADTVQESLRAAEELEGAVHFTFCGVRIYPGTEIERVARAEGQIGPDQSLLEPVYYRPPGLPPEALEELVHRHAAGRRRWVIGDGSGRTGAVLARLHQRDHVGPLWEHLGAT